MQTSWTEWREEHATTLLAAVLAVAAAVTLWGWVRPVMDLIGNTLAVVAR